MSLFAIDIEGLKKTEYWTELTKNKTLEEITKIEITIIEILKKGKSKTLFALTNQNLPLQK